MATIQWVLGDVFFSKLVNCYGMVIPSTSGSQTALMIKQDAGAGHVIWNGNIPADAIPVTDTLPYEVNVALCATAVAFEFVQRAETYTPPYLKG